MSEKFWYRVEFRQFMVVFTILLVWAPLFVGIPMALAENLPSKQEIRSYLTPDRQDLPPCCPHRTCRFHNILNP